MNYTGLELRSTYRAHVYTRPHLRTDYINNLIARIDDAMTNLAIGWDIPTAYEWDKIADAINEAK